ncbi:serine hydrolase [Hymenobacter sp. UYP22]|uniref:serine hydrolase domain-containing protein n=1 Tax=Hymenobacter sp. UYP22 TaxID=3156348 RepID=UPI00339B9450
MLHHLLVVCTLLVSSTGASAQAPARQPKRLHKSEKIDSFMTALYNRGQFTGAILVAEHGRVIYKKAFGQANRELGKPFTPGTQGHIASITKPFTAMGIMVLKEQGKLSYDQPIRQFFPGLPACMQPVTLRHLLQHTSGVTGYADFPDMTQQDVFKLLQQQGALHFQPGQRFEYSNGGYMLLGMVIEKVSGQSLNGFLTQTIFRPLGMKHTQVDELPNRNVVRAIGYDMYGKRNNYDVFTGGDGSMISTVEDLYKWDQALYHPRFIKAETLAEAFTPSALSTKDDPFGEKSYGFGWWITERNGAKHIAHNGAFGGYRADIERFLGPRNTIIHLSNLRHSIMFELRDGITNILEGKPYALPKVSVSTWLYQRAEQQGMPAARQAYWRLKQSADSTNYNFSEGELNSLGYYLKGQNRLADATEVFLLNTEAYPHSANAFDSLGEAYLAGGDKKRALSTYQKSLNFNPANTNALAVVRQLQAEKQ